MLSLTWKGRERLKGNFTRVARGMPEKLARAEYEEFGIEMQEMKRRTPVWNPARPLPHGHTPGSLRASGVVHEPEINGSRVSVSLSFGNEGVDYAVYVHEDLDAFHASGQAKFAESVLNESRPYFGGRVARRVKLDDLVR